MNLLAFLQQEIKEWRQIDSDICSLAWLVGKEGMEGTLGSYDIAGDYLRYMRLLQEFEPAFNC